MSDLACRITIDPTGESSVDTGMPRYRVVCHSHQLILHRGTTNAPTWVTQHMDGKSCAYEEPLLAEGAERASMSLDTDLSTLATSHLLNIWVVIMTGSGTLLVPYREATPAVRAAFYQRLCTEIDLRIPRRTP